MASDIIPTGTYRWLVSALSSRVASATPTERIDRAFQLGCLHQRELARGQPLSRAQLWRLPEKLWVCVTDQPIHFTRLYDRCTVTEVEGFRTRWVAFATEKELEAYLWAWGREGLAGLRCL